MALFQPFRALGYVSDSVPFAIQRRGKEVFVCVSVGKAWQIFNAAKLTLVFVGPQTTRQLKPYAPPMQRRPNPWLMFSVWVQAISTCHSRRYRQILVAIQVPENLTSCRYRYVDTDRSGCGCVVAVRRPAKPASRSDHTPSLGSQVSYTKRSSLCGCVCATSLVLQLNKRIRALATKGDYTFAASGRDIIVSRRYAFSDRGQASIKVNDSSKMPVFWSP
eukprot:8538510-Pyramimonas_sp.AAC.1